MFFAWGRGKVFWSVAVVLALAVFIAGTLKRSGSDSNPTATESPAVSPLTVSGGTIRYSMQPSDVPTTCTVSLSGHDAMVQFASNAFQVSTACQAQVELGASQGNLWVQGAPNDGTPMSSEVLVCHLVDAGGVTASVWDTGEQDYGQGVCTGLLSTGSWTETSASSTSCPAPSGTGTVVAPAGDFC